MLSQTAYEIENAINIMKVDLSTVLIIIGFLYAIHLVNWILGYRLNIFGIFPRKLWGLVGIPFHAFLHGSFNHLFFNSIPLFVLLCFMMLYGWSNFLFVTAFIIITSGIGVWLIGRKGVHIGASGLIMGYWSYLLVNAYYHPTVLSIALAIVILYYFGSLAFSLFPQAERSSFEAHICGFLAGLGAAYINWVYPNMGHLIH